MRCNPTTIVSRPTLPIMIAGTAHITVSCILRSNTWYKLAAKTPLAFGCGAVWSFHLRYFWQYSVRLSVTTETLRCLRAPQVSTVYLSWVFQCKVEWGFIWRVLNLLRQAFAHGGYLMANSDIYPCSVCYFWIWHAFENHWIRNSCCYFHAV